MSLARVTAVIAAVALAGSASAQTTITEATRGMDRRDGYFPIYWNAARGRVLMEIPSGRGEFLYLRSLATGIGIAGPDIDRGLVGDEAIARFERVGPRVLLVQQTARFRATGNDEALQRSVRESFPTSALASLEIVGEEGGRVLVDATPLLLQDVMDVRGQLREAGEGSFSLDRERSAPYMERTKAFPKNTELEATLTFTSDQPGQRIRAHTPDGRTVTVREHHSFVELPEPGFTPRRFDPRVGIFPTSFYDFSTPFDRDFVTRYASRHRLIKKDPGAAVSEPVEPIIYYLDRGVPEPYRTAFKQGAMWWAKAFEAAGFRNAFRVEDMPADMDPLDARYNVIQWVHRTSPSSSWGSSFIDPRTGEIIKAAVRMDSWRSVPDYNIYATAVLAAGSGAPTAEQFVMSRRRQHSAHEVGHTLGLAHNFIASSYGGRASAMAYPAPLIKLTNGRIDLSDAYREGLGSYDTLAIRWAYTQFPAAQDSAGLAAIVQEMMRKGVLFLTNPDEGAEGSYPEGTTWVNGEDAVNELARVLPVRRALLAAFDERAIQPGAPMAQLNMRLTDVYLHHRFTIGAAVKAVGGMEYRYAVRGDTMAPTRLIPAARQRRALTLLLDAIQPQELAIPEKALGLIAPRPFGVREPERRQFQSDAGPAFDQIGAARTLATMVVRGLFAPERAARLVAFADRDPSLPSLSEVVSTTIARTWGTPAPREHAALQRVSQRVVVDELIRLAADEDASVEARAGAEYGLRSIARTIRAAPAATGDAAAHRALALADIERFLERQAMPTRRSEPLPPPAGTPIGEPSTPGSH